MTNFKYKPEPLEIDSWITLNHLVSKQHVHVTLNSSAFKSLKHIKAQCILKFHLKAEYPILRLVYI